MNKAFLLKIFFSFYFTILTIIILSKSYTVCENCELNDIQKAIDNAHDFDTIYINKGIYKVKQIIINKPLTIIGQALPTIDGQNLSEIITILSNNVTIDGLKIINVGKKLTSENAAIRVKKSNNILISNNILENVYWGIYLEKANNIKVINNKVSGFSKEETKSGNGLHAWYCKNLIIQNNYFIKTRDGLYFEFVDNSIITKNTSTDNIRYGLHFMFSNDDSYTKNVFKNNGTGVAVMFSKRIEMYDNEFTKNWSPASYGLLLKEIYDADIQRNRFYDNTVAISIEGTNRIKYNNNHIIKNGFAIKVLGGCFQNEFINNNFIDNSFDFAYSGSLNENIINNNYWSAYSGYDLNYDNLGDVPYRPVKLFSYITNTLPESILLLNSFFIAIINFSESVFPSFTPSFIIDNNPLMSPVK